MARSPRPRSRWPATASWTVSIWNRRSRSHPGTQPPRSARSSFARSGSSPRPGGVTLVPASALAVRHTGYGDGFLAGRLAPSALDVGECLCHPPSPDPEHVNTADMPVRPSVVPTDYNPITCAEQLLHLKMRGWRTVEEGSARLKH